MHTHVSGNVVICARVRTHTHTHTHTNTHTNTHATHAHHTHISEKLKLNISSQTYIHTYAYIHHGHRSRGGWGAAPCLEGFFVAILHPGVHMHGRILWGIFDIGPVYARATDLQ